MSTRLLVIAMFCAGCLRAAPPAPLGHQPDESTTIGGATVEGFDPFALRGADVDEVWRVYAVTVMPDGVTTLVGNGIECTDVRAADWSLSVKASMGRVKVVELMLCRPSAANQILTAVRRRLGEPTSGACWNVCSWDPAGVFLAHHATRTVSYDVLILE